MFTAYVVGLVVTLALAGFAGVMRGGSTLPMAAACLLYNWAVNQFAVMAAGDPIPWRAFVATDGLCFAFLGALAVSSFGLARVGSSLLALTYAGQLWLNLNYVGGSLDAEWDHWRNLTWIAFGQLAIVAAWAGLCLSRVRGDV